MSPIKSRSMCYQPIITRAQKHHYRDGQRSSRAAIREVPDCDKHSQLTLELPISRSSFHCSYSFWPLTQLSATDNHTGQATISLGKMCVRCNVSASSSLINSDTRRLCDGWRDRRWATEAWSDLDIVLSAR
jgi:hypothetical protein